jgi:hypothetical protein
MWWLMPVILATWEVQMGRIKIRGQLGQKSKQESLNQ